MQESLSVTHGALEGLSADIAGQAEKIGGVMDSLESSLKSKLQANWQGQASNSFDTAKRKFNQGMADLNSLLADIGKLVQEVNTRYADVDRQQSHRYTAR